MRAEGGTIATGNAAGTALELDARVAVGQDWRGKLEADESDCESSLPCWSRCPSPTTRRPSAFGMGHYRSLSIRMLIFSPTLSRPRRHTPTT